MADPKTAAQAVREIYEQGIAFWQPRRDAMRQCREFLAGDRLQDDHGAYNRDRRLIQIRGQETPDTIRHIVAKTTEQGRSIETRPIDQLGDPDDGEAAATLTENELGNPWKGFDECYEAALTDAREKRLGIVWMTWEPECGPFGEMLYSRQDAERTMWDPAFESPHHPMCSWLLIERRPEVEDARRTYKSPWLEADRDAFTATGEYKPGVPLIQGANGQRLPSGLATDNRITLWECWYKNDKTEKPPKEREGSYSEIADPEERYMVCVGRCGYRSDTQGDLRAKEKIEAELPELLEAGCPTCKGDLERIDAKAEEEYARAYTLGKRLVIIAPFCAAPDDKTVYDGDWPIPTARSFPGFFITAYPKGGEPTGGPCDVEQMWDQQIASDHLRTMAVQRVSEFRTIWEVPKAGVTGPTGKRFRPDMDSVFFRDGSMGMMNTEVKPHAGAGLDPQFSIAFGITQAALTQFRGMHDQGPIEERQKAKSGVALQTENAIGEVPVAHFNRRKNRELSKFYGVVWDYIRATYTPARLSRLNIDGIDIMANLSGDDFPNFDFVIADMPEFTGVEEAKSAAFDRLMAMAMDPRLEPFMDIYAELNNLPRSVVRKIQRRIQEVRMAQQEAAAAALEMGPEETGTPEGEPGAPPPQEEMLAA